MSKFRVWDGKKMLDPDDFRIDGNGTLYTIQTSYVYQGEGEGEVPETDWSQACGGEIVMQYIGLKYKGVEIYAGDIVEMGEGIDYKREVVRWSGDLCGYHPFAKPNSAGYYDWRDYDTLEPLGTLCGNIYENPDLTE